MHKLKKEIQDWIQEKISPSFYQDGSLNLYLLAQHFGIWLYEADFNDDSISWFITKKWDSFEITINRNHSLMRKRFTIAHEIGHYISSTLNSFSSNALNSAWQISDYVRPLAHRQEDVSDEDKEMELEANSIAWEILMPRSDVERYVSDWMDVSQMASIFSVSESAMTVRLMNIYPNNYQLIY